MSMRGLSRRGSRGGGSVSLPPLLIGVYGVPLTLTATGLPGLTSLALIAGGLALTLVKRPAGALLAYFTGYAMLTLAGGGVLALLGLSASAIYYVYMGAPSTGGRSVTLTLLRILPFAIYGSLYTHLLYTAAYTGGGLPQLSREIFQPPGGYPLATITGTAFFTLLAYWFYSPSPGVPRVERIAAWLYKNKTVSLELLVYTTAVLSGTVSTIALLAAALGGVTYAWIRALGFNRALGLLGFTVTYAAALYALGLAGVIDSYFP